MSTDERTAAEHAGRTCQLTGKPFVPCNLTELDPLLAYLRSNEPVADRLVFPRGTLLADGRLDLCKQGLGPAGTRAVAEALKHNRHVSSLMLGDDGARAVADVVRANEALGTVYLGCNSVYHTAAR